MTKDVTRRWFPALLILCAATAVEAQELDYIDEDSHRTTGAVWTEVSAVKVLPYDLYLGLDAGFRTDDWFNEASRYDFGLGLGWKPGKHWKFGVGYTFIIKHYPIETAKKNGQEREYNYRNTSSGEDVSFSTFPGATYDDDSETASYTADGTSYRYQGYSDVTKDYTRVTDTYWRARHRVSLDAAYTQRFWKTMRVTLRERYQLTFLPSKTVNRTRTGPKTETDYTEPEYDALTPADIAALATGDMNAWSKITYEDDETTTENETEYSQKVKNSKNLHVLRSRLTFEIDKKGWSWTPYIYLEPFNNLNDNFHLDKLRAAVGVDYAINKQHKIGFAYIFNHENDDDGDENIHALSISYRIKF